MLQLWWSGSVLKFFYYKCNFESILSFRRSRENTKQSANKSMPPNNQIFNMCGKKPLHDYRNQQTTSDNSTDFIFSRHKSFRPVNSSIRSGQERQFHFHKVRTTFQSRVLSTFESSWETKVRQVRNWMRIRLKNWVALKGSDFEMRKVFAIRNKWAKWSQIVAKVFTSKVLSFMTA